MSRMQFEQEPGNEYRYDPATQQKVIALASRLQQEQQETLTAKQMEEIGSEVGLEPPFIQKALAQLTAQQTKAQTQSVPSTGDRAEFWSFIAAFTVPLVMGTTAYLIHNSYVLASLLTSVAPVPLAALLGFLTGKKRIGFAAALTLMVALAPGYREMLYSTQTPPAIDNGEATYALLIAPLACALGTVGAWARQKYFPFTSRSASALSPQNISRSELLTMLFTLQSQLEGQKQHRAFLSVDVVGSTEMKKSAPELAVEYSFTQFRQWVEQTAQTCGGQLQSAAGDGMMALFPNDAGAVEAAKRLQVGIASFNAACNRLPLPFRIRCGVSAGEIALEEGTPIGHLHSPVIDRAALLQKRAEPGGVVVSGEVTAAALVTLGNLAPLPEPVNGETAFSWRRDQGA